MNVSLILAVVIVTMLVLAAGYFTYSISKSSESSSATVASSVSTAAAIQQTVSAKLFLNQNLSYGPFAVQFKALGQSSDGVYPASIYVYYSGELVNISSITPPGTAEYTHSGQTISVSVSATYYSPSSSQWWAQVAIQNAPPKI